MRLKNAALSGIMARNIIVRACMVNSWLNTSALTAPCSALAS